MKSLKDLAEILAMDVLTADTVDDEMRTAASDIMQYDDGTKKAFYDYEVDGARKRARLKEQEAVAVALYVGDNKRIKAIMYLRVNLSLEIREAKALVDQCGDAILHDWGPRPRVCLDKLEDGTIPTEKVPRYDTQQLTVPGEGSIPRSQVMGE